MARRERAGAGLAVPGADAPDRDVPNRDVPDRDVPDGDAPDRGSPTFGPYDEDDLDPEVTDATGRVDFGALRVPVPRGGAVSVEPSAQGRLQAVHVTLPEGRLSVSALAAPRTQPLWPELATEIHASLRDGGASVRSFQGEWGRELQARTGGSTSVFVGVDGPRWMVYGVATGPTPAAGALDAALRRLLKATVVVRGRSPYPVRTVLPLTLPEHLAAPEPRAERQAPEPAVRQATPSTRPPDDPPTEPIPVAVPPPTERIPAVPSRRPAGAPAAADEPVTAWDLPPYREPDREPATPPGGPPAHREPDTDPALPVYREPDTDPALPVYREVLGEPTVPVPAVSAAERPAHQPALAYLIDDPLALFSERPRGRHRRPE